MAAQSGYAQLQAESSYWLSDDSDDSTQQRVFADLSRPLADAPDTVLGAGVGHWRLSESDDHTSFRVARGRVEHAFSATTQLEASASLLDGQAWSPTLGTATLSHMPDRPFYVELSASRGLIDTLAGIDNHWDIVSVGGSLDIGPFAGFTVVGGYTQQALGDGNDRAVYVLRLIHEPAFSDRWLVQTRTRLLRADFDSVGFFAPERLDEHLLLVTYRRPVFQERWFFSIEAGGGVQTVNRGERKGIYTADLVWRGWFNDHFGLDGRGGCMNTGGLDTRAAGGGYMYCQAVVSLLWSW
ncbi:hypothetical protein [Algiphilus aromaticivorans]|uniref:hypothetical protein n=1 Tax=Algiphilus aromaticivorans TaxID=382454 RepID=UPI0012EC3B84|nr:hypothetical protein [Algiphilus aromaticivorans]